MRIRVSLTILFGLASALGNLVDLVRAQSAAFDAAAASPSAPSGLRVEGGS